MIRNMSFGNATPFTSEGSSMDGLKKINIVYGPNGTGKTSMSKLIGDPSANKGVSISWNNNTPINVVVFNRDFIRRNFSPKFPLKGIFTLGENQISADSQIQKMRDDIQVLKNSMDECYKALYGENGNAGKVKELSSLDEQYLEKFWRAKKTFETDFSLAFKGHQNTKKKFMGKILHEAEENTSKINSREYLTNQSKKLSVFALTEISLIEQISFEKLREIESTPVIIESFSAEQSTKFWIFIQKMSNADWVHHGISYFRKSEGICPFCQQKTPSDLIFDIGNSFGEEYDRKIELADFLLDTYRNESASIVNKLESLLSSHPDFVDKTSLITYLRDLEKIISHNIRLLENKRLNLESIVSMDSVDHIAEKIQGLIDQVNQKITDSNLICSNRDTLREELSGQMWKFVLDWLKPYIKDYLNQKKYIENSLALLEDQLGRIDKEITEKSLLLRALETQFVSIQPTIEVINRLLALFGFANFSLERSSDDRNYQIVRPDGSDALMSLSEGEGRLLSFLYFYFLLYGNQSNVGVSIDKIVVIDDPISGLDNQAKFIVISLIRQLVLDLQDKNCTIKQLFIFSHDTQFLSQIQPKANQFWDDIEKEITFWELRKLGNFSILEKTDNLIANDPYSLLWSELRNQNGNNSTIKTILMQILENFFCNGDRILTRNVLLEFDEFDRKLCLELCHWLEEESFIIIANEEHGSLFRSNIPLDRYLDVFKRIFEVTGNSEHYHTMMESMQKV
jgi:wobble nucleotide-excising tRNase